MRRTPALVVGALAACMAIVVGTPDVRAAGRSTADEPDEQPVARVITLGDSYSSGVGTHRSTSDYDDTQCGRELDSTPGTHLAADLGATATMVACSGAVIADIDEQLAAAKIADDGAGTVVTLTIGGNDVRSFHGDNWPNVLIECITDLSCDDTDRNGIANLGTITDELSALYLGIGEDYPDITVRVLGYPRLMQTDKWCEGVTGVNHYEADWIDGQVDDLNDHIAAAALLAHQVTGADIEFVSVVDAFDNHGACRFWQRDRYVNDALMDGVGISNSSFHPSTKGYRAYYEALSASIGDPTESK